MVRRGKRQRYREARLLKAGQLPGAAQPGRCVECGSPEKDGHASWCLAGAVEDAENEVDGP